MSKITCDICGTVYDDAAGKCPVCDWSPNSKIPENLDDFDTDFLNAIDEPVASVKPAPKPVPKAAAPTARKAASDEAPQRRRPTTTMPAQTTPAAKAAASIRAEEEDEEESGSNTFLVIILVLLILALLAVSGYIGWTKFLKPKMGSLENKPQETVTAEYQETVATVETAAPTEAVDDSNIPCVTLEPVGTMETLTFKGQYWRLMVTAEPENTTDKIIYTSEDESIVTIDDYGRVTAVGEGETNIVVTCGSQSVTIPAAVSFQTETATEAPTEAAEGATGTTAVPSGNATATPSTTITATGTLKLKKTDITFYKRGVYFTLELEGGIAADDVKWSTSDSGVANVYNGVVTALGRGVCVVKAEYNGQTAQCVVRVKY